ncbi:uncharacterized protein RCO7_08731 [Rhynchosporium graminicola]|uniref:Uncharacterized protein n=1 Tax=Rhynchosporium graminicola TaxID=2792576 RepID=A0A1E1KCC9_9HELO|nr:uncharacterized protein RCO7_08731 [Rhynchosporium commune]
MATSALRSAFIESQSRRHQTRSVVRATTAFLSPSTDTPPPPIPKIPRQRKLKRRAIEPEEEEVEEVEEEEEEEGQGEEEHIAKFRLASLRKLFHRENKDRRHHKPGYEGRKTKPHEWAFRAMGLKAMKKQLARKQQRVRDKRSKEIGRITPPTLRKWLEERMDTEEHPSSVLQKSKREQLALDKIDFMENGTNLNKPGHIRYRPWKGSKLSMEVE